MPPCLRFGRSGHAPPGSLGLAARATEALQQAPLSPAFEAYLESLLTGEARPLAIEDGQVLGVITSPIDLSQSSPSVTETAPAAWVSLPATHETWAG